MHGRCTPLDAWRKVLAVPRDARDIALYRSHLFHYTQAWYQLTSAIKRSYIVANAQGRCPRVPLQSMSYNAFFNASTILKRVYKSLIWRCTTTNKQYARVQPCIGPQANAHFFRNSPASGQSMLTHKRSGHLNLYSSFLSQPQSRATHKSVVADWPMVAAYIDTDTALSIWL